ncbi:FAD-binding protein [Shewanella surugensis]|uniref:FAD-binding protein n=1 Tax=Shewanella surugensis TaxID=212020 RepID=A0ABT0LI13_9GAMM|nr:FAD-binding protein [Shewanella surugensis]MCL1127338.1 FAD-binding protein [Shewanella surugensis]
MDPLLKCLIETVGSSAQVLSTKKELAPYLRGTEGFDKLANKKRHLFAVIQPNNTQIIDDIVSLANTLSLKNNSSFVLYPICSGRNWGYNTSQPAAIIPHAVILDLSTLSHIKLNKSLGLVTIEPGVTQAQLSQFLIAAGDEFMVPVTGAGPDCAIMSNALERGYGITPNQEHFSAVTALKGIWGNGTSYRSAVNELDQSGTDLVDKTFKWGIGPYMDGLFTQSNFGIVTEMTLRLAYRRKGFIAFFIQVKSDDQLEAVVPLIHQTLRDYEGIVGSINLMDKRRVISMFADNPNGPDAHITLSDENIVAATEKMDTPAWTLVGSLYGTEAIVNTAKKEIIQIFKQTPCKMLFSDSLLIKLGDKLLNKLPHFVINLSSALSIAKAQIHSFNKGKEIMLGRPNPVALKLAYWRNKNTMVAHSLSNDAPLSPGKDGCGLLWYAPLVPMNTVAMRKYVNFIREICPKHNIEPFITFTNLRYDCIDSTIPIVFDLSNPKAVSDAHDCLKELVNEGLKLGFVPYRLNIDQQHWLLDGTTPFWRVVDQLKSVLDPNDIISRGRYNPKERILLEVNKLTS